MSPRPRAQVTSLHIAAIEKRLIASDYRGVGAIAVAVGVSKTTVCRVRDRMVRPRSPRFELVPDERKAPETLIAPVAIKIPDDRPLTAAELYQVEKEKRRLHPRPALLAAKAAYEALLERDKQAGRGGRPKNSKPINSLNIGRGRPNIYAQRVEPVDALWTALGHFAGSDR